MTSSRPLRTTVLRSLLAGAALVASEAACAQQQVQVRKDASSASPAPAAPSAGLPLEYVPRPTVGAITAGDLMSRIYLYADDSLLGRDAATPASLRATEYIAGEARRRGLVPAGENGTYFQSATTTYVLASQARIVVEGRSFGPSDFLARPMQDLAPTVRDIDGAQAVYGGVFGNGQTMIDPAAAAGKIVVFALAPAPDGTPRWQARRGLLAQRYPAAAAIVIASLDAMPAAVRAQLAQPATAARTAPGEARAGVAPSFLYASGALAQALLGAAPAQTAVGAEGRTVRGTLAFETRPGYGRNVVAILPGADARLRGQYVAIGAHNDHVGTLPGGVDHDSLRAFNTVVRPQGADDRMRAATPEEAARIASILDSLRALRPARLDSVFNGADDDASGSMAMLEVAEAFATARTKPRRSLLFVWHTAEEKGLFGSEYFTDHPTVPRDSIVAQINMDMIGRGGAGDVPKGGPGYMEIIGSRRLSTELGDLVEAVNAAQPRPFTFNYEYDAQGHPQQYYCRSDHYSYARYGIPVVFFSTGGHRDYHQVTDEPQYIDYPKLARVTQLVHDVVARVAALDHRVVVDKTKPADPHGACRQ